MLVFGQYQYQEEGWSYGEAQKATGVPKTTIHTYFKTSVINKQRTGRKTTLTNEEELCLVEWWIKLSKVGFPVTDDDMLDQVQKLLKKDGRRENQTKFDQTMIMFVINFVCACLLKHT